MRRILFLVVPLVFAFVSCGDKTTTRNTSYQTLYATVSGSYQTLNSIAMNSSKYGRSCFVVDPLTELVSEVSINTTPRDNSSVATGATILLNKMILEVSPINGTPGTSQTLLFNNGIPSGPLGLSSSAVFTLKVPATIFPEPTEFDAQGNLLHNQYEVWVTAYVQEFRGANPTSPEGWFQMFWGLLYTAPPVVDGDSACIALLNQ